LLWKKKLLKFNKGNNHRLGGLKYTDQKKTNVYQHSDLVYISCSIPIGWLIGWLMMFNATFNNISVISWRPVLLVEETREPGENLRCYILHFYTTHYIFSLHITFFHYTLHFDTTHYIYSLHITFFHYTLHFYTTHYIFSLHITFFHYTLHFFTTHYIFSLHITFLHYTLHFYTTHYIFTLHITFFHYTLHFFTTH
jgi:hypothetical protein